MTRLPSDPETLTEYLSRRAQQVGVRPKSCTWTPDDEGTDTWATSCDNLFLLSCDTPHTHGMRYCCYCGGALVEGAADE